MSTGGDAEGIRRGGVPGPRGAELPLPPAAVPAGPHDGDIADGLAEAHWSVYDGAASEATVGRILARLPRIVRQIGWLASTWPSRREPGRPDAGRAPRESRSIRAYGSP
ncbi:hypothetical protein ACFWSF_22280 [Streptomyces sp. NPDC058611]|uniref:hypothetical protein n=1 Tax=unclassified Streptomyces TaxID=2593676 RepID=UPI00365CAA29